MSYRLEGEKIDGEAGVKKIISWSWYVLFVA